MKQQQSPSSTSPNTMKAAIASSFGQPNEVLSVVENQPKPSHDDDQLLIRVHAVSLSPSDYRTLLGQKTIVANPSFPFIPGGDVSGVVEHVPESLQEEYKVGDRVLATWHMYGKGGMAQHALVDPKYTMKLPLSLSFEEGAALANNEALHKNDLKIDRVINYKQENWWQLPEFQQNPFDVVIDCAEGRQAWYNCGSVVKGKKDGGRWVAVIMQDWHIDGQHFSQLLSLLLPPLGRALVNCFRRTSPEYRIYLETVDKDKMEPVVDMAAKKEFKVVIDSRGPFPFTTEGVRDAWNLHIARGGHGKIVIGID